MGTKSRERIYGSSIRAAAEQAATARKHAGRLACEAWNKRRLGRGPAQPSPTLGDALNARYLTCPRTGTLYAVPELLGNARLALRPTKISASDPPSTWWPGER